MSDVTDEQIISFLSQLRNSLHLFKDPVWAATEEMSFEQHVSEFRDQLTKTIVHFDLPEETTMHYVVSGQDGPILFCSGNAPNSGERSRILTGVLTALPAVVQEVQDLITIKNMQSERINELLEENNKKLFEIRALRAELKRYKANQEWLLDKIADDQQEMTA